MDEQFRSKQLAREAANVHVPRPMQPVVSESLPAGWFRVSLLISPDGSTCYATGGDRLPGDGGMPYPGYEIVREWKRKAEILQDEWDSMPSQNI